MIKGPPVTGKTMCVVALIGCLMASSACPQLPRPEPGDKILRRGNAKRDSVPARLDGLSFLICSSSNAATDLIMERIHDPGTPTETGETLRPQMIRVCGPKYTIERTDLEQYTLRNKTSTYAQYRRQFQRADPPRLYSSRAVANEAILCFATPATCTSHVFTSRKKGFDVAIIDEGTRVLDPEAASAILTAFVYRPETHRRIHVVFVGDDEQLGVLPKAKDLFEKHAHGLKLSAIG